MPELKVKVPAVPCKSASLLEPLFDHAPKVPVLVEERQSEELVSQVPVPPIVDELDPSASQ
ncbi:hypothetical protein EBZ70_06850 [bacterium]|nr:hypothetical protein [bacterium]